METFWAFIAGAFVAWLVMGSKRSAIDHALERGVQVRNPHPMPAHRPDPPPAPPSKFIDDPTLSPDQVLRLNGSGAGDGRRNTSGGGWPA